MRFADLTPSTHASARSAAIVVFLFSGASHASDRDPWFGRDKGLHFAACTVISSGGYGAASLLTPRTDFRLASGAALGLGIGAAKEVFYDRRFGGDVSFRDFSWDVIGTGTGLALSWLIDRYLF
jgi:putative lipoprotein